MPDGLKQTPLHDEHVALGGKMVPFAGFSMPVQYPTGITAEHRAVREACGLFDVSHMGEFIVRGPQALELVQRISVNDAARIEVGQAQYSAMCLESGCVIDDLNIYRFEDRYMLVVNASNVDKDWAWLERHADSFDVETEDVSEATIETVGEGKIDNAVSPAEGDGGLRSIKRQWFKPRSLAACQDYR